MFRSVAYDDLRGSIFDSVVSQEFFSNCLAQFRDAGTGGVFGKARFEGCHCSGLNVLRSIKIRLTCSEGADIDPFRFHGLGLAVDRKGEGWSKTGGSRGE